MEATETKKRYRQEVRGVVVSDKMSKTRVIEVKRVKHHGLYHKNIARVTRVFVHDEKNESKVGDKIVAGLTRPLSKNKHFRLLRIER